MSYEEPVTSDDGQFGTKTTHPAFAQIVASRCSGHVALYGSDFLHHNFITISIKRSELNRNLSNDWHFPREELIEVALSEAQWATFVSAMNQGGGVPCTLQRRAGEGMVPRLPDPEKRSDQFSKEMQEDFAEAVASLNVLRKKVEEAGLSKKKTEDLLANINLASNKMTSAAPFVADQFGEHMEKETERAKVEIHGYATQLFHRAGVAALAGDGPLSLPGDTRPTIEDHSA